MKDPGIDETQRTIAELMRTPVGRRWLLKMGVTGAAALAIPSWAAAQGAGEPLPRSRRGTMFHFALGAAAQVADLQLVVNGHRVPLTPHTRSSHSALRAQGTLWRKINLDALTHFAAVPLPRNRPIVMWVYGVRNGRTVVVAHKFHTPATATAALAAAAFTLTGSYGAVAPTPCPTTSALGLDPAQLASLREIVDVNTVFNPLNSAIALTMYHPNVATIDPTQHGATHTLLSQNGDVCALGTTIQTLHDNATDYVISDQVVNRNGQPSQITIKGTDYTFSTNKLNKDAPGLLDAARTAFVSGIHTVRDTQDLGTVLEKPLDESPPDTSTWHQPQGIVPRPIPYVPPTGLGAAVQVRLQNFGTVHGTQVVINGDLSGRHLPLKLYNNFVRWVFVYVQYLKADGTNLSIQTSPTWPDTKHAQALVLLPQVFTLLGIPLFNTNTLDATLDFPGEATSARLLFCGLGSNGVDGGWRQYFPADAYDANHVGPTDEVLLSALMTGIVTLGLTGFALAREIDTTGAFGAAKDAVAADAGNVFADFSEMFADEGSWADTFTDGERGAMEACVAGGLTRAAASTADANNIWNTLAAIGSAIPKIIFSRILTSPMWPELAATIVGEEVAEKILDAIPIVGEILAVIQVAGDLATLAEAIAGTVSSPWVFANYIYLTYAATVTVKHDDRVTTWPRTARSWTLEAKIDGAAAVTPQTGTLTEGQSDDIVLHLTAPFGGGTITWSIVVLDGEGHQVGTGVSAQLPNNDPNNVPSSVTFAITELPEIITAATVFKRSDTTTFDPALGSGSYTWSDTLPANDGTIFNKNVEEVTGVAIATRLGVVGLVWKQNDLYFLRGVRIDEVGRPIVLGGATRQRFNRRPFLLFDSLVDASGLGNHVLLEPDDASAGYHVRRLTIDPTTGDLSWDPTVSAGFFPVPVSAAGLHSAGTVVVVATATGRVGRVLPVFTPRPPLAAYTAGPGSQVGLLSSPTAVAVTNPGIVIVLEAGASQLAAFDLNGNPVRYFGTGSPPDFTLPLFTPAVYLDVAVDGSGQIYVLSYRGDGAHPIDYRIDVYTASGVPLGTNSTGANVPHIAVDYWRSIYAANYTALINTGTKQPQIDPVLGVVEPSLSVFDPDTP
jgi:hypothetical protein